MDSDAIWLEIKKVINEYPIPATLSGISAAMDTMRKYIFLMDGERIYEWRAAFFKHCSPRNKENLDYFWSYFGQHKYDCQNNLKSYLAKAVAEI